MLVIIDVQEYYIDEFQRQKKNFEEMIVGLAERVRLARECCEPVINLTHFGDGFTLPEVIELVKSVKRRFFLGKEQEDGSQSVHCLCQRKNINPGRIELCGAFRDVCVLETWKGLKRLEYNVTPVKNKLTIATGSNWRNIQKYPDGYLEEDDEIYNRGRQQGAAETRD